MKTTRWIAVAAVFALAVPQAADAAPIDTWPITHGIDCVGDRFNPVSPDGTRDPDGDPQPGTSAWSEQQTERVECTKQRDHDRRYQVPWAHLASARYGEDWYRQPIRFDGRRWRYTNFPTASASEAGAGIPGTGGVEIHRPCSMTSCPNLPAQLQRFEPPYPVVVIWHGAIAQGTHHRFNAQTFAENGYLAISLTGTAATGAPNFPNSAHGTAVLDWLHAQEHPIAQEADLNRIGFAGHSAGAAAAAAHQGNPDVSAIVAWDSASLGDSVSPNNCTIDEDSGERQPCAPIMYPRADGAFSAAQTTTRAAYPADRNRGLSAYDIHVDRGMDVMHFTLRAASHIAYNGYGVGLDGSRLSELVINYYSVAWLDRHVKGKLAFDGNGNVVTSGGRADAEERAYRQAQARWAFDRLTSMTFLPGSIDKHNISMGFYDPIQHAQSGDPLYGGNVPYKIEGLFTTDRLATDFRSFCRVSVPDYVNGATGAPGDAVPPAIVADTGGYDKDTDTYADMRYTGCPIVS